MKFNYGNVVEFLQQLNQQYGINSLFSNEETGLMWSWERDKAVAIGANKMMLILSSTLLMGLLENSDHVMIGKNIVMKE